MRGEMHLNDLKKINIDVMNARVIVPEKKKENNINVAKGEIRENAARSPDIFDYIVPRVNLARANHNPFTNSPG